MMANGFYVLCYRELLDIGLFISHSEMVCRKKEMNYKCKSLHTKHHSIVSFHLVKSMNTKK